MDLKNIIDTDPIELNIANIVKNFATCSYYMNNRCHQFLLPHYYLNY